MFSAYRLKQQALLALLISCGTSAAETYCDTTCQQIHDPHVVGSLSSSIVASIFDGGHFDIILGRRIEHGAGWYESSALWNLWAKALEVSFPSRISHIIESGHPEDRVCIDMALLAKLTAAASNCHAQVSHPPDRSTGSRNASFNLPSTYEPPTGSGQEPLDVGSADGASKSTADTKPTDASNGGSSSSSTWGHGNVNNDKLCFRIKDKRTDRYLTTYGTEYAFAYYPNYYSVFRAYPSRSVENGYSLTEVNRNGAAVNYPVKINSMLGSFKPLTGDTDAIFTFKPANFGDTCWGVPGKKMSRRHDWSSWGDNYRFGSAGDDCADVELEEASC